MNANDPIYFDANFRRKRRKGGYVLVDSPALESPVADTHCHLQLLQEPAFQLAKAGANDVHFLGMVVDVVEDDLTAFDQLATWEMAASILVRKLGKGRVCGAPAPHPPRVRIVVGCHPHNAKDYDDAAELELRNRLRDPRVSIIGEIGLDYHYDLSSREDQRRVFRRQIRLAHELNLPIALHVRDAHQEALSILDEEGFPKAGVLLHCYTLGPEALEPWLQRGCYIAFGGAVTFKKADEVREAAALVPLDRLLTETDAPFMTPEPMRGMACEPAHVVFVAARLAELREQQVGMARRSFLDHLMENARGLMDRDPHPWQDGEVRTADRLAAMAMADRISSYGSSASNPIETDDAS